MTVDVRSTIAYSRTSHIEACPDIGPACASEPQPEPYWHHVDTVVSEIPVEVAYGLTSWLAAEVRVPLRIVGVWPEYRATDGTLLPLSTDTHHRRETLVGPADPWLSFRVVAQSGPWMASARLGVSLPLGRTEPDPFALGRLGLVHQHIQFGSGTVMPVLGAMVQRMWERVEVGATAMAVGSFVDNSHGYRAPSRAYGSVRVAMPFLERKLRPFVATDVSLESSEMWHGTVSPEGSTARADLLVGGGVSWQFLPRVGADASFRVRVAKLSEGSALDFPGYLQLGATWAFDLKSAPQTEASSNW